MRRNSTGICETVNCGDIAAPSRAVHVGRGGHNRTLDGTRPGVRITVVD
jgi:hypothetical protein